jgi:asparagine synthase (glutamine-hydrolysing)
VLGEVIVCAVAGILELGSRRPDPAVLERMLAVQGHRGPDDVGTYVHGPIALGHRRLAIIDLSPAGHQPMASHDRAHWLVFNGEVFNYIELRTELAACGHEFHSSSDTEVVLHAYAAWGPSCLERMNGMFAFALWDARRRELFCARDRLGVKPFYYHTNPRSFVFASEIKALFAAPSVSRDPDLSALARFLAHELQDDEDGTSFVSVCQLPPGHSLRISASSRSAPVLHRWWSLPDDALDPTPSPDEVTWRVRTLFDDAVRLRLRSDVPVGSCLSGGLDSSSIVCTAAAQLKRIDPRVRIHTFSARSDEPEIDEGRFIDQVVHATGAEPHEIFPTGETFRRTVARVIWHQEEPFHAPSVFAQYEVMRIAHETGLKVLLDGQAGDELFAGYYHFVTAYLADLCSRGHWRRFVKEWSGHRSLHRVGARQLAGDVVRFALPAPVVRMLGCVLAKTRRSRPLPWLGPALADRVLDRRPVPSDGRDRLHAALRYAMLRSPLPNYLHHEDRNSMAWSIEARTPFLDYRLVEYVSRLSGKAKITDGWTKSGLREAMRGVLPEPVRRRADKQGFSTPHVGWFRREAADLIRNLLTDARSIARGWIDSAWAHRAALDIARGHPFDEKRIWRCAALELWARILLDPPVHEALRSP